MKGSKFTTAQYGDTPPDVAGLDVAIVDFSYPRETLLEMQAKAKSLIVIDHHQTAQDALQGLDFCIFDMSKSGAVLAWEYFHHDKPLPKLMAYVQDRDLWRWELPFSQEVSAALRSYKPFLSEWERFLDDQSLAGLISEGAAIVRYQNQQMDLVLSQPVETVEIGGYTVPCVNATHMISELGNELAKGQPFAALYFDTPDKRVFSLRSTDDGIDVAEIARMYGGGGHRNAAGFTMQKPPVLG
jgi:oligoribonuclease NrnB/cAMP/cGMP phosphodiesterase (DHH superfamily)